LCTASLTLPSSNKETEPISDLQEVGLVCQWDGLSKWNVKGVGWDAAQEGHGVRATEKGVDLTSFSWDWVLILVLQS